ncbi:MAG: MerR family transcriptional regulator [Clostridiales bacterium]|nr:MerR family transcriptional regulator [Eubacteriales bacterium]MDH7566175.1 MerR family transcriptional regulator [Clostridiales bacterium]
MPDVRNCRRCGKIYNHIGGPPICPACREADEEDFKRVKEYLYENPGATLSEVSSTLDISVEKIKMYLKEGRLEIVGDEGNIVLECENCGRSIRTGRLCNECSKMLVKDFSSTAKQMKSRLDPPETSKKPFEMRYLNKTEKK